MRKLDLFIGLIFVISTIALGIILLPLQLIPTHYAIILFITVIVLILLYFLSTLVISTNVFHMIRRSLGILMSSVLVIGCIAFLEFDHTISQMTEIEDNTIHIRLIARSESPDDLSRYHNQTVGIYAHDYDYQQQFIDTVKQTEKVELKPKNYADAKSAYEALLHQKVSAIIVTSSTYDELNSKFNIADKVRLVYEYSIVPSLQTDLLNTPFHILIQGIDRVGSSSALARSDVNMIASVNLKTKQILLTSIPRDAYIKNPCLNNQYDKLTHISLQGSQCSINALASYFDIPIDYYVKVSFSSVITFIDTIGGVNIDVPMKFCEYDETKKGVIHINKGMQTLDGRQALAFARHRYTLYDGDMGRNRNQQLLFNALIKKTASPKLLSNIDTILDIMKKTVLTNLDSSQIYSLIRFHFDDARPYLIQNQSVVGNPAMKVTASIPYQKLSVVQLYESSQTGAAVAMNQMMKEIDLSNFTYSSKSLKTPTILQETKGAQGTNRCHIP